MHRVLIGRTQATYKFIGLAFLKNNGKQQHTIIEKQEYIRVLINYQVKYVTCHLGMERSWIADRGDDLQIWMVYANIFIKSSRTAKKGWIPVGVLGRKLTLLTVKDQHHTTYYTGLRTWRGTLVNLSKGKRTNVDWIHLALARDR
jgi:hypothetical protein